METIGIKFLSVFCYSPLQFVDAPALQKQQNQESNEIESNKKIESNKNQKKRIDDYSHIFIRFNM
jgi:hypothetical protein